jgi:hypothetical protein
MLLWLVVSSRRLIFYQIIEGSCDVPPGAYERIDTYIDAVITGICPIVLILLGCRLLRNVRQVIRRQAAAGGAAIHLSRIQRLDAQLTTVLLLESVIALNSFLPYAAEIIFNSISSEWDKSPLDVAWENVISAIIRLLTYVFYGSSFYISFWLSHDCRQVFFQAIGLKRSERNYSISLQTNARATSKDDCLSD